VAYEAVGGVSNVDRAGNNAWQIKARGVVISTFETLPPDEYRVSADIWRAVFGWRGYPYRDIGDLEGERGQVWS